MKFSRYLMAVDSHTMGEPTRVVVGGLPNIPGETMADKKEHMASELDSIRTTLMCEPRGHLNMFGSVLTAPVRPDSAFGIVFMDGGGYLNMCGHGSIGAVTVAIETGIIESIEPSTRVCFDSPAGTIDAQASVKNGQAETISLTNVPSFLYESDISLEVPGIGRITFDIAFGGSFFAIMPVSQLGLTVEVTAVNRLIKAGMLIRKTINEKIKVRHPELAHIKSVDLVEFYDHPTSEKADSKNVVIFGNGQADRSPCGTGTSAKMAMLHAKGALPLHQEFVYESIVGTMFTGRLLSDTVKVGDYQAVIPEITGSAYITAFNQFVIDNRDPLRHGFLLN